MQLCAASQHTEPEMCSHEDSWRSPSPDDACGAHLHLCCCSAVESESEQQSHQVQQEEVKRQPGPQLGAGVQSDRPPVQLRRRLDERLVAARRRGEARRRRGERAAGVRCAACCGRQQPPTPRARGCSLHPMHSAGAMLQCNKESLPAAQRSRPCRAASLPHLKGAGSARTTPARGLNIVPPPVDGREGNGGR